MCAFFYIIDWGLERIGETVAGFLGVEQEPLWGDGVEAYCDEPGFLQDFELSSTARIICENILSDE